MDRVEKYRQLIRSLLEEYHALTSRGISGDPIETDIVIDTERDHYQLIHSGWRDEEHRVYGCVVHIDIKNEKVWIQYDGTDYDMANELVTMGVPKEDIVLGFQPPYKRPYSGFGVN